MREVLDLIGVSIVRDGAALLDDVTWTVRDGERWVVLGPNGAGKTTLLQIAGARLHPTRGSATILGETLGTVDVFELRPRIGLSSAAFAESLPAHEQVGDVVLTAAYAIAGRWREQYDAQDHRRAEDLLAAFGVQHLAHRTFGTLSEGERKRVQLARSLMTDPEIVLLDEPAAGLDLGGRETLVRDLAELAGDRRSPVLVLVTHHVEEIPPGFTHALLVRQGRVVAAGPVEETITSEALSATFDLPLEVERVGGRYAARLAPPRRSRRAEPDDLAPRAAAEPVAPDAPTSEVVDEPVAASEVVDEPVAASEVVDEPVAASEVVDEPVAASEVVDQPVVAEAAQRPVQPEDVEPEPFDEPAPSDHEQLGEQQHHEQHVEPHEQHVEHDQHADVRTADVSGATV
jgi:iron complex transport system ATP-binding protein